VGAVMLEIKQKQQSLENIKKQVNSIITNLLVPSFNKIGRIIQSEYNIFYNTEEDWNQAVLTFYNNFNDLELKQNCKFQYHFKIENFNQVIVYSSGLDPDLNAFRPQNIFGDYEILEINNIKEEQIFRDVLEKYKISQFKYLEENFKGN
jgi:hypothetical protein